MHVLYRQEFDPNGSKASAQAGNTNGVELPESVKLSAPRVVKRVASWLAHRRVVGSTLGRSVGAKPRYLPQPAATELLVDRVFLRLRLHDLFQASGWVNSSTGERAAGREGGGRLAGECSFNAARWQHNTRGDRVVS